MIELAIFISTIYFLMLLSIIYAAQRTKEYKITRNNIPKKGFSILIAFKNEAANLKPLINSLNKLSYPLSDFEVIFINDHSSDKGKNIIEKNVEVPYQLLDSQSIKKSSKKEALETGVKHARFEYILTTDADCEVPKKWLSAYNHLIQEKKPKMILGPVKYRDGRSFIEQFQIIEFLSLQAFTMGSLKMGSPFLANGANLCFEKKSFLEVNGYYGNKHIASGDDIFLLEKFRKAYKEKILFLKSSDAIITTYAQKNWNSLLHQKLRWASKSRKTNNLMGLSVGIIILFTNLFSLLLYFFLWINPFFLLFYASKFIIDWFLIRQINTFYKNQLFLKAFIYSYLVYPFYTFLIILTLYKKNYIWKDNKYKT